ncbi:MAG: exosortase A, partial [Burkholderiales bacterium]
VPLALVALCFAALLITYWPTAQSMFAIWRRSDTFAHGVLVAPLSAYLIWTRRKSVALLVPAPEFLPLSLLAAAASVWLVSNIAGVLVLEQYSFVAMAPLLVWIVLGSGVAKTLAFPLFFLLFAVPAGEILTPPLMEITANFTVFMLSASGIPVHREGLFFAIPSGKWTIVEACSGLRYLIASVTLGCLFAYLTYQRWQKRIIFVAACAVVPIAANCVRAYLIVMIGHLSDMNLATGVDHLVYGWLFFAVMIGLLFWVGSRFRDRSVQTIAAVRTQRLSARKTAAAAFCASAVLLAAPAYAAYSRTANDDGTFALSSPESGNGWIKAPGSEFEFSPQFLNARASLRENYRKGGDNVGLFVAYYRNQREHGEMISSQNVVVASEDKGWRKIGETDAVGFPANATELRNGETRILVWQWYWVDGAETADPYWAKFLQVRSQLFAGTDEAAAIFVFARAEASVLRDFLRGVDIKGVLEDARQK